MFSYSSGEHYSLFWEKRKISEPKTELQEGVLSDFQIVQGVCWAAGSPWVFIKASCLGHRGES